ncbi:MAG: hypothetical protein ACREEL_00075 [Stellaceae bacterium]
MDLEIQYHLDEGRILFERLLRHRDEMRALSARCDAEDAPVSTVTRHIVKGITQKFERALDAMRDCNLSPPSKAA